jgi:transcriptional regulator of acetoin/glycerol metabolism
MFTPRVEAQMFSVDRRRTTRRTWRSPPRTSSCAASEYDGLVVDRDDTTTEQVRARATVTSRAPGLAVVFQGGAPILRLQPVGEKPVAIGRGTAADLFVDDGALSRIHCEISYDGAAYTIADRSKHGTFVDGRRVIGRITVESFRALRIGESVLVAETDVGALLGEKVEDRDGFIVGPRLRWREQDLVAAARAGCDILVTGETGTGKEWASKVFHAAGADAGGPRVTVNVAAIPANLIEGELFGHVKGAFSGADRDRVGLFEAANSGTVFLDEIGDLPSDLQPKLLRVLQERAVRRLGDTRERSIDVRFVAATNRDLEDAMAAGTFRSDLYFRLAKTTVHLPALRDRIEDLAFHVARELGGRKAPPPSSTLIEAVLLREWEGNARELSSALAKAARNVGAPRGGQSHNLRVDGDCLPPGTALRGPLPVKIRHERTTEPLTEQKLRKALEAHDGNISATAQALGVHRNTLHRHIARLGIRTG